MTTSLGSINKIFVSFSAHGLCSNPFGTTYISPSFKSTWPSLNFIFKFPSNTTNVSSVSL
ncbi:uncharacterized protein METZ01_LOCUS70622 [marine metagenome]|uniref:Uncharacterized protein n=1 Tax=marine metagenome TaxID=408172 RepID=A0A381TQH0_9ZZZZ